MITTDTRHKIKVYKTPTYVEHFRLYLENKVVIKNNNLCFFCTQNIKESAILPFPLVKFLNNDFDFLVRLADSMGEEYSKYELIPPYISSCKDCLILVKDPDLLSVLQKPKKEKVEFPQLYPGFRWTGLILLGIYIFYFGVHIAKG